MEEKRVHARVETSVTATVATLSSSFEAEVVNLSLGGAGLKANSGSAVVGDSLTVMLESVDGMVSLALSGSVVHVGAESGGQTVYGVHFEAPPPDIHSQLVLLLRLVAAGRGSGRRETPRVARRLVVTCGSHDSFRAVLHDLSRGGFSVTTSKPVTVGARLEAQFGVRAFPSLIAVGGPVLNVTELPDGQFRVGVKFEGLPQETFATVSTLIEVLLGITK